MLRILLNSDASSLALLAGPVGPTPVPKNACADVNADISVIKPSRMSNSSFMSIAQLGVAMETVFAADRMISSRFELNNSLSDDRMICELVYPGNGAIPLPKLD